MAYPLGTVTVNTTLNKHQEVITTTGTLTWTCPSVAVDGFDVTSIDIIEAYGGGGRGGPTSGVGGVNGGGGGGGGAYARRTTSFAVTPGNTYTVVVPAANSASSVLALFDASTTVSAGTGNTATGTAGATGSSVHTGDVTFNGANGTAAVAAVAGVGGGGAGSGGNASGQTGGAAAGGGLAGPAGGTGGAADTAGAIPAGGGGGATGIIGTRGGGNRGQVILYYNKQYSASVAESVSAPTEAIARAFVGARAIAESVSAPSDAINRQVAYPRAISESVAAPSDSVARQFTGARTITETTTVTDYGSNLLTNDNYDFEAGVGGWAGQASNVSVSSSTEQANTGTHSLRLECTTAGSNRNAFSDFIPVTGGQPYTGRVMVRSASTVRTVTPTFVFYDATQTIINPAAGIFNSGTPGTSSNSAWRLFTTTYYTPDQAAYVKIFVFFSSMALGEVHYIDTAIVGLSGVARQVTGSRAIAESITAPTDAIARVYSANRSISENVDAPIDSIARTAQFNRSIAEAIDAPTDAVSRQVAFGRAIAENVDAPTDTVARLATFNRSISEVLPGEGGGVVVENIIIAPIFD